MKICKHESCDNPATFGKQCQPCRNYLFRYKMTQPQVKQMLNDQQDCCLICNKSITLQKYEAVVDHCHKTGNVRGILCHDCNVTIGYLENSKVDLSKLKDYLSS